MARATKKKAKTSWIATARKSKSFWMQLHSLWLMAMTFLTNGWDWLLGAVVTVVGVLPTATSEAQQLVTTNELWAGWLKYEAKSIVVPIVMCSVAISMLRHVRDKRNMQ